MHVKNHAPRTPRTSAKKPRAAFALGVLSLLLFCFLGQGCTAAVGDECVSSVECVSITRGAICDVSVPGGYCTLEDCVPNGCPDDSVCVQFDPKSNSSNYCMAACQSDSDCREDLVCNAIGTYGKDGYGFCYIKQ